MSNPNRTRFGIDFDYFDISKTILDKICYSSQFSILSPNRHQKLFCHPCSSSDQRTKIFGSRPDGMIWSLNRTVPEPEIYDIGQI